MDQLIQLLTDYKEFTQRFPTGDFARFGAWLQRRYAQEGAYTTDEPGVDTAGLDAMVAYLLGGLTTFVETWIKLSFSDLPLLSLGDFGIIKTVERDGTPSKSEIAAAIVMERSSCNESIKRLRKAGLLAETTDSSDRRIKRVSLTPAGQELSARLDQKMTGLGTLLMGNLTESEKQGLIPPLKKLNGFHRDLYERREEVDIAEVYGLK